MGTDYSVEGIAPPDTTWMKMKDVWDACRLAEVAVPKEVDKYFEGEPPDPKGVVKFWQSWNGDPLHEEWPDWIEPFTEGGQCGVNIDTDKLPPHVRIVRFKLSW